MLSSHDPSFNDELFKKNVDSLQDEDYDQFGTDPKEQDYKGYSSVEEKGPESRLMQPGINNIVDPNVIDLLDPNSKELIENGMLEYPSENGGRDKFVR